MQFREMSYNDFWLKRMSRTAIENGTNSFTEEEIRWAMGQTDYKYFGDYEMSDQQKMAVDILVWVTQQYLSHTGDCDDNPTMWGE